MSDRHPLRFFASYPHACPYIAGEEATEVVVDPETPLDGNDYGRLLEWGFRRSGELLYRPGCARCDRCVPVRIPVDRFHPRRSQRRVARRNADLSLTWVPAAFSEPRFRLYRRYLAARHPRGGMDNPRPEDFERFLIGPWCDTRFGEFRLGDHLVAVAVTDFTVAGLSAVYTFFEPELGARGLGVNAILAQVETAAEAGLAHLYLGYWIEESPKMDYKRDYRPLEAFDGQCWRTLGRGR